LAPIVVGGVGVVGVGVVGGVVGNVVDVVVVVGIAHAGKSHVQFVGFIEQSCEECQHHPRKPVISWTHQTICAVRDLQVAVIRAFSRRRGDWSRLFLLTKFLKMARPMAVLCQSIDCYPIACESTNRVSAHTTCAKPAHTTTYKSRSAVNRPIVDGIVPINWLLFKYLRKQCPIAGERTSNKHVAKPAHTTTYKKVSAVNCPIVDGIVPIN
jgi:hypothetical protein